MGKWRTDVDFLWHCPLFRCVVKVARYAREGLQHHLLFMQKKISDDELFKSGGHYCQLICGKADEIFSSFSTQLVNYQWFDELLDVTPVAMLSEVVLLTVELVVHHACAYNRRVRQPVGRHMP